MARLCSSCVDAVGKVGCWQKRTVALRLDERGRWPSRNADLKDFVRRAGLIAIRKRGEDAKNVNAQDFAEALEDSRATVTEQMEEEYGRMRGELKRRAMEVRPIGFIHEGMLESRRERKHSPEG